MNRNIPRIVIAGTRSGTGKTSLALALTCALRRRGLTIQTFKTGPDFLDPTYLARASGRPCYNLDGWMMGRDYAAALFARAAVDADIAVVEGVMGLFDGADPAGSEGSTAEIARLLGAPVLLVVDARGAARSVAALVKGFSSFEDGVRIAGVIANRCASEDHSRWLSRSLEAARLPALAGSVPRDALPLLSGRHLGLVAADRCTLPQETLDALGRAGEQHLDLESILEAARDVPAPALPPETRGTPPRRGAVAVAYDRAFHFYYRDLLDELESGGCELLFFSPLDDAGLPAGAGGLYIGGGYPEAYAAELSANSSMLESIRSFAASGRPVYAECGGLMYLSRELRTLEGGCHPMAGVIPAATRMRASKKFLGYVEATLAQDSLWGKRGDVLRGHEFHYSELSPEGIPDSRWKTAYALKPNRRNVVVGEGFQRDNVLASYAHLHYASRPLAVAHFVAGCGRH